MREICFRGYNAKNKIWLKGFYFQNRGAHFVCPDEFANGKGWEDYEVEPQTVGQFTGVTTSDGQEIWEGDIIHIPQTDFNAEMIGVVEFECNAFIVRNRFSHCTSDLGWVCRKRMLGEPTPSIIGNIYDNPELLKVGGNERG